MTIVRMPTDYASRKGAAQVALRVLQAQLDKCRTEAQRADENEILRRGSGHERVALEAAEWAMAYGYFSAVIEYEGDTP